MAINQKNIGRDPVLEYLSGNRQGLVLPSHAGSIKQFSDNDILSDGNLSPEQIRDLDRLSDTRDGTPMTPLRTAWEVGRKWSHYLSPLEDLWGIPSEGEQNCVYGAQYGRVKVQGYDTEHFEGQNCNITWGDVQNMSERDGPVNYGDEYVFTELPPYLWTYRGWAGCTGWTSILPNDRFRDFAESRSGQFKHGYYYIVFSNVCDTGDLVPLNEGLGSASDCTSTGSTMGVWWLNRPSQAEYPSGYTHLANAVAVIAPTDLDTDTRFNNLIQDTFLDMKVKEGHNEIGKILMESKRRFTAAFGSEPYTIPCDFADCDAETYADLFYGAVYQLMGDPSTILWGGNPGQMVTDWDDNHTPSPWGRWNHRRRNSNDTQSDENNLSISNDDIFSITVSSALSGKALQDITGVMVYEKQLPYPHDQVYTQHSVWENPAGRKNWYPYILRSVKSLSDGKLRFNAWNNSDTWIEGVGEITLAVGDYIKIYLNSETRRTGRGDASTKNPDLNTYISKPREEGLFEQRVLVFRLQE